jgi:hypothetical protein
MNTRPAIPLLSAERNGNSGYWPGPLRPPAGLSQWGCKESWSLEVAQQSRAFTLLAYRITGSFSPLARDFCLCTIFFDPNVLTGGTGAVPIIY